MPEIPEIAKSRLNKTPPQMHPDVDLLAAFAEQRLDPAERSRVLKHLGDCSTCRDIVHFSLPEPEAGEPGRAAPDKGLVWKPWLRWGALAATVAIAASITLYMQRETFRGQPATFMSAKNVALPSASKEQSQAAAPAAETSVAPAPEKDSLLKDKASTSQHTALIAPGRDEKTRGARRQKSEALDFDEVASIPPGVAPGSNAMVHQESKAQAKAAPMIAPPPPPPPPASSAVLSSEKIEANVSTEKVQVSNDSRKAKDAPVRESESQPAPALQRAEAMDRLAPSSAQRSERTKTNEASAGRIVAAYNSRQAGDSFLSLSSPAPAWRLTEGKLLIAEHGEWKDVQFPPGIGVKDVVEQPGGELWVVTSEGKLYRSTHSSAPWQIIEGGWNQKIQGLVFMDAKFGQVFLDEQVWVTSDGGKTWRKR